MRQSPASAASALKHMPSISCVAISALDFVGACNVQVLEWSSGLTLCSEDIELVGFSLVLTCNQVYGVYLQCLPAVPHNIYFETTIRNVVCCQIT